MRTFQLLKTPNNEHVVRVNVSNLIRTHVFLCMCVLVCACVCFHNVVICSNPKRAFRGVSFLVREGVTRGGKSMEIRDSHVHTHTHPHGHIFTLHADYASVLTPNPAA